MKQTGDEYFDSEEFQELLANYEKAVSSGEPVFQDADELTEIADYYQLTGNRDEADHAIQLALSLSPGAMAPLTYKIHEALYDGDTDKAEQLLEQVTETSAPDYAYCKGEVMLSKGLVEEADRYFNDIFKTVPPDECQDYIVDVANIFSDFGYSENAMEWMARAQQEESDDFKELMARTLFELGKYKDSERIFNELIDRDPFSAHYWNALASAQLMNEEYSEAVTSSEYAIAIAPNSPDGLISKANGLFRLDNYEEAEKYFARYAELMPDDEYALMQQAACLINLNRSAEAVTLLRKALDLATPDSPYLADILQELAFAYSETGETDKALDCLNATEDMDCDHIQMLVVKGHILLSAGLIDEAEDAFRQAILRSDNAPQTLLRVIISLYDNQYMEAAYQLFLRFFSVVSDDWDEGYSYMALTCYELKRYEEFLKYLKKACTVNPKEAQQVLRHLFPSELKPEEYYNYIKDKISE